jgi:GH15 family glucan-1,4-alpha-glucosidase
MIDQNAESARCPQGPPLPPRLDHGVIGNGRVLALVSPRGSIDWLCLPRFDSPSVFGRLLDEQSGGSFGIRCGGREVVGQLSYLTNTNVLTCRFEKDGCVWEMTDFAPRVPSGLGVRAPMQVMRILRPVQGQPLLQVHFDPRPDYGRAPADVVLSENGLSVANGPQALVLESNLPAAYILGRTPFVLNRPVYFVLSQGPLDERPTLASVVESLNLTVSGWRTWVKTCALPVFAQEEVLRSALCLKLHISLDTGAIIAAATTSIPEAMGTERTWDYRYCWLRDAAFVVEALRRLTFLGEGERFIHFLRDVAEAGPLQPVYGIGGERELPEEILPHLAGFGGNGHVRTGNAAYLQRQNDPMGEVILCLNTLLTDPRLVHDRPEDFFPLVERLVEEAIAAAPTPDTGIWEFRSYMRHHTFSKSMCWAAMQRGAFLAKRFGRKDLEERWTRAAESERDEILSGAFHEPGGFFAQAIGGDNPDASNLLMPMLGIIEAKDPRFVSTVTAYERLLVDRGLVLRYRNPDDFGETTSAFTMCTFWLIEALALMGRLDEAIVRFRELMTHANPLGLLSEDIDPTTGALLGNFPQAYAHVGLIHAATTIGALLEARSGKVRAWA